MSSENPLVSIVVRTKDRPGLLLKAIRSIADQDYRPLEIVLVNDGGEEPDLSALRQAAADTSLIYVAHEQSLGRAEAANTGIRKASGVYLGFLDDDDMFLPDHVSTLAGALRASDFKVAYSDCRRLFTTYEPEARRFREDPAVIVNSRPPDPSLLLHENYIPFICLLMERSAVEAVGYLDPAFELYEDWDFIIRLSRRFSFLHVPRVTALYRHWNPQGQLAFIGGRVSEEAYLQVVRKYFHLVTPEVLLRFYHEKKYVERLFEEKDMELRNVRRRFRGSVQALSRVLKERIRRHEERIAELGNRCGELERGWQEEVASRLHTQTEYRAREEALQAELDLVRGELDAIRSTLGWRFVQRVQGVLNRLFPPHSLRGWPYQKSKQVVRILAAGGPRLLARKIRDKIVASPGPSEGTRRYIFHMPERLASYRETLDQTLSVVIPTRNAGPEFEHIVKKILSQKGIRNLELLVVDSGSTDRTLEIAREAGAVLIEQEPEGFSHSKTRNLAAGKASGDFLLFTTQDAIPAGEYAFYQLVKTLLEHPEVAAVTAREIPRMDADPFASWQIANHSASLDLSSDLFFSVEPDRLSSLAPFEKRKIAQLNNICCCIRKTDFDSFRFGDVEYAEDLDLGLRLLEAGRTLAYLHSVGVIHSHNRPPLYFLKRSYVDTFSLSGILGYDSVAWEQEGFPDFRSVYGEGIRFLRSVCAWVDRIVEFASGSTEEFAKRVLAAYGMHAAGDAGSLGRWDSGLSEFLEQLNHLVFSSAAPAESSRPAPPFFTPLFRDPLQSFLSHLCLRPSLDGLVDEARLSLIKLASVFTGAQWGAAAYYFTHREPLADEERDRLDRVSRLVKGGI